MRIRTYTPSDKAACLAILAGNMPRYFRPHEEPQFAAFLDDLPGPYLILEERAGVVGCGGYAVDRRASIAALCWGMVARARHRRGLGRILLLARLVQICRHSDVAIIRMDTSQHTSGFFEREGFVVREVTPNGYAPGLDKHEMRLVLDRVRRDELARRWASERIEWADAGDSIRELE